MAVHLCLKDDMCNKSHGPLAMYIVLVNSVTMLDSPVLHFNRKKRRDGPNDRLFTGLAVHVILHAYNTVYTSSEGLLKPAQNVQSLQSSCCLQTQKAVPRFTGKTNKIPERPKNNRETSIQKLYVVNQHIFLVNCEFLYSGHYRKWTL